jgi:tellurite methyltransferase
MESEERTRWDARYTERPGSWTEPDDFLKHAYDEFLAKVPPGRALDLAGGAGRNALYLAERGWQVKIVDISEIGLQLAKDKWSSLLNDGPRPPAAALEHSQISTELADLETVTGVGADEYDLIMVFYFLRRDLFPALVAALKPGGLLIYKTYTTKQQAFGNGPGDRRYLLQPNELREAFPSLHVLRYAEKVENKSTAELVARK